MMALLLMSCQAENQQATKLVESQTIVEATVIEEVVLVQQEVRDDALESKPSKEVARERNTQGFELYQLGKYEEALTLFEEAIEQDDTYFYPYYNYACTLGVLMKLDYPRWYDSRSTIHEYLKKVVELNPEYIEKIKTDRDLDEIRKDYEYLKLIGYTLDNDEDIAYILQNVHWSIHGPGIFSHIGGFVFSEESTFVMSVVDISGESEIGILQFTGTYEVKNGEVLFSLDAPMLKRRTIDDYYINDVYEENMFFKGTLDDSGTLYIEIFDYPIYNWKEEFSA